MKGSKCFRQLSGQWRTLLFTVNKIRKTCLQVATSQKYIEKTLSFFLTFCSGFAIVFLDFPFNTIAFVKMKAMKN